MSARFRTIAEKGGLSVHLAEQGLDADYFYHLLDMGLDNTAIAKLLNDKHHSKVNRHTVGKWRKLREGNDATTGQKST